MRAYNFFRKIRVIFFVMVVSFTLINPAIAKYADELTFLTPLPTGNNINDAWSPDGLNIFFAGDGGTIMHYDGSGFSIMPTPTNHSITGIHGTSMNDIWAVGGNAYSDLKDPDRSVIMHYNGTEWKHYTPPADSWGQYFPFNDVWSDGDGTVWAVTRYTTSVARMTNKRWEFISTTGNPNFGLYSIYGFSPNNIYAAGACGQILRFNNGT